MNDLFTTRVRAAAVAGWWTVLVAIGFLLLLWLSFLWVSNARPAWALCAWGPEATWPLLLGLFLRVIVVFRFLVWLLVLAVIWLTLWARELKKRTAL
jgi:hypothetical protein